MNTTRVLANPHRRPDLRLAAPPRGPRAFHERLDGYVPTPLREAPTLARALGADVVRVKDESSRLGLPAFKMLGATWAVEQLMRARGLRAGDPVTLVAATDGNHGRAIARIARDAGLRARIYVPAAIDGGRRAGLVAEGAEVVDVHAGYNEAIDRAAADGAEGALVVSDMSWDGYQEIPVWIADGYSTLFGEVDAALGHERPDVVAVQIGVGSLAQAAVTWACAVDRQPVMVGVEPLSAACALASVEHARITPIDSVHDSRMDCLLASVASSVAFPALLGGIDHFVAIADSWAMSAVELMRADGIASTPTGAAGAAGLLALADLGVAPSFDGRSVLVINTEGPRALNGAA